MSSMRRIRRKQLAMGVVAALLVVSVITVGVTAATRDKTIGTHPALKIAGGNLGQNTSWGIWLYHSRQHGDCWSTRTLHAGHTVGESAACGFEVPQRAWQLIVASPIGQVSASKFVLAFLTQTNIHSLEVLVNTGKNGKKAQWIRLANHRISRIQRGRTQLPQNVGYATAILPGSEHCVRRVKVVSGDNNASEDQLPRCH
jgi:hypothetical protein